MCMHERQHNIMFSNAVPACMLVVVVILALANALWWNKKMSHFPIYVQCNIVFQLIASTQEWVLLYRVTCWTYGCGLYVCFVPARASAYLWLHTGKVWKICRLRSLSCLVSLLSYTELSSIKNSFSIFSSRFGLFICQFSIIFFLFI